MENLFDETNQDLLAKLKYFACFTFPIQKNDGFPEHICIRCTRLLETAYEFKMICESAEANFWALTDMDAAEDVCKEEEIDADDGCDVQQPTYVELFESAETDDSRHSKLQVSELIV